MNTEDDEVATKEETDPHQGRPEPAEFGQLRGGTVEDVEWIYNDWDSQDQIRSLTILLPTGQRVFVSGSLMGVEPFEPTSEAVEAERQGQVAAVAKPPPEAANQNEEL